MPTEWCIYRASCAWGKAECVFAPCRAQIQSWICRFLQQGRGLGLEALQLFDLAGCQKSLRRPRLPGPLVAVLGLCDVIQLEMGHGQEEQVKCGVWVVV